MIFSCTKKVRDKLKKHKKIESEKEEIGFSNWYVDEIRLGRFSYFLFTHSETLFSLFVYAGTKKEHVNIETIFAEALKELIIREISSSKEIYNELLDATGESKFTKTNSRSLLGCMNEFKYLISANLEDGADLAECHDLIHHRINKVPMGMKGNYFFPVERMKTYLENRVKKKNG